MELRELEILENLPKQTVTPTITINKLGNVTINKAAQNTHGIHPGKYLAISRHPKTLDWYLLISDTHKPNYSLVKQNKAKSIRINHINAYRELNKTHGKPQQSLRFRLAPTQITTGCVAIITAPLRNGNYQPAQYVKNTFKQH